jgi:predicted nucleotidyltransferase
LTLAPGIEVPTESIAAICRKYSVKELAVFGSAARGEMRLDSDVDILVEFQPEAWLGLIEFSAMERELADLFARKVDLVSKRGLKPRVRPHVLRDARVLYAA